MRRREFVTLLASAAATWPLAARAQQGERMRRIGVLVGLNKYDPDTKARLAGFRQGLGWSEGRNVRIDYRFAPASAGAQVPAKELVALQPDVILVQATPLVAALKRESRTIPIVFVGIADPVGSGFVTSLARPGGNLTGLMMYEVSVTGKWLEMLKEIAPRLARIALVFNPKTAPYYKHYQRAAEAVAPLLAVDLVLNSIGNPADIEYAIDSFARSPNGGLLVLPDSTTNFYHDYIVTLAARHRLPAVYSARFFVAAGGLMSYGFVWVEEYRQAAYYVDRILRGDKPADLPVQVATKFETVVNLKTAKALGLTVPPALLARADEVIE
jgi:putative ABC transport system substrate-binding protein